MGVANCSFLKACVRVATGIIATAFVATAAMGQPSAQPPHPQTARSYFVYVGGRGIHQYRFDAKTGTLTSMGVAAPVSGESWLATDPGHRYLYTIGAPASAPNQSDLRGGSISSYSIDPKTGALTYLNSVSSPRAPPTSAWTKPARFCFRRITAADPLRRLASRTTAASAKGRSWTSTRGRASIRCDRPSRTPMPSSSHPTTASCSHPTWGSTRSSSTRSIQPGRPSRPTAPPTSR